MKAIIGKTIATVQYVDPWGEGLFITFTDGTSLRVYEAMQAGEICVKLNNEEVESDWRSEP
jgi:hypothetical protein